MDPRPLLATPRDLHGRPTTMRTGQFPDRCVGDVRRRRPAGGTTSPNDDEDPTAGAPTGTIAPTETCRGGRAPARGGAALARNGAPELPKQRKRAGSQGRCLDSSLHIGAASQSKSRRAARLRSRKRRRARRGGAAVLLPPSAATG